MTILNVLLMTVAELFGNAHLKWYAENGKNHHVALGVIAWLVVLIFLVKTLKSQSMMWTCIMWEAAIVVGGAITAYFVFGEKFTHWVQWLGVLFALAAAIVLPMAFNEDDIILAVAVMISILACALAIGAVATGSITHQN
jgi:multidrug transporter EmrE-like cation transporter